MSKNKSIQTIIGDKLGITQATQDKLKDIIAQGQEIIKFASSISAVVGTAAELLIKANISKSSDAIYDLMQPDYWRRTFDENAVCKLEWGQIKDKYRPPAEGSGGFVWDYRLTLSTLLYAISARLLILQTLEPKYRKINRHEINGYADYLLGVYSKIRDGIIRTPAPPEVVTFKSNGGLISPPTITWKFYENPCGAVEVYSGLGVIEKLPFAQPTYYSDSFDPTPQEKIRYAKWFYQVFTIRVERAWQALYKSVGLPELWNTIVHLKQIVGEYLPVIPPDLCFSLRAVVESPVKILCDSYFGEIRVPHELFDPTPPEEPIPYKVDSPISMRNLAATLGQEFANEPLPGSTETNPIYSSQISLRRMLAGD